MPELSLPAVGAILDNGRTDFLNPIVWDFDWQDCAGAGAYQLYVIGAHATLPIIDITVTSSNYAFIETSGYIIDENRLGWTWRVRASINGHWGAWSQGRLFDVEPVNTDPPLP